MRYALNNPRASFFLSLLYDCIEIEVKMCASYTNKDIINKCDVTLNCTDQLNKLIS